MVYLLTDVMRAALLLLPLLAGVHSRGLKFGPIAEANHNAKSTLGCDPDYGWSDGAEGSGKCYMLIKNFDYSTCYSDGGVGGFGMSWFDAMESATCSSRTLITAPATLTAVWEVSE